MAGRILVAKTTFRSPVNQRIIRRDLTTVREGHPIAVANPDKFKPFVVTYDLPEEDAPVAASPIVTRAGRRAALPPPDLSLMGTEYHGPEAVAGDVSTGTTAAYDGSGSENATGEPAAEE